jgi:hypothetical protein
VQRAALAIVFSCCRTGCTAISLTGRWVGRGLTSIGAAGRDAVNRVAAEMGSAKPGGGDVRY